MGLNLYFTGTELWLNWDWSGTVLRLNWGCAETELGLNWVCTETELGLNWGCSGTELELYSCGENVGTGSLIAALHFPRRPEEAQRFSVLQELRAALFDLLSLKELKELKWFLQCRFHLLLRYLYLIVTSDLIRNDPRTALSRSCALFSGFLIRRRANANG